MQISILLISILVLTMINIFFVECRYSLFKIDEKVLENIEEKNKMKIKLKLEGCLFAKEVISVEKYKGNNKIRSLINYVFQVESYIYFMNKEKIAVFVKEEEHL